MHNFLGISMPIQTKQAITFWNLYKKTGAYKLRQSAHEYVQIVSKHEPATLRKTKREKAILFFSFCFFKCTRRCAFFRNFFL